MIEQSRYSRQILIPDIGETGQKRIMNATVVILGLGALGSTVANILARAGVGTIHLVDRDFVDWTNLQRQGLYEEADAEKLLPKAVAAKEHLARINSEIKYVVKVDDVNPGNIEEIITGASVVVDCVDNFYTRALLNEACIKQGIPWVHGACVSSYGEVAVIVPGLTGCYNCFLPKAENMFSTSTCDTVGVLGAVTYAIASWEASEALKIILGKWEKVSRRFMFLDLWDNQVTFFPNVPDQNCDICGQKEFFLLTHNDYMMTATLCGRQAIQIYPNQLISFNFEDVLSTLQKLFPSLELNEYLLKIKDGIYELVLFRDGRAIIFGTSDIKVAKSLYGRYIGG